MSLENSAHFMYVGRGGDRSGYPRSDYFAFLNSLVTKLVSLQGDNILAAN